MLDGRRMSRAAGRDPRFPDGNRLGLRDASALERAEADYPADGVSSSLPIRRYGDLGAPPARELGGRPDRRNPGKTPGNLLGPSPHKIWHFALLSTAMPGHNYKTLIERAADQFGLVTPADAAELGVDPTRLVDMAKRGVVERVGHGVYRFNEIPRTGLESYMQATLWPHRTRGVLSHETALDIYGLSDANPAKVHITVPRTHRITRKPPEQYTIHHEDLDPQDVTLFEGIPIVTPERAIRQAHAGRLRPSLIEQAIDDARRTGRLRKRDADRLRLDFGWPLKVGA